MSTSGIVITLGEGPVYVQSTKQKLVSKSSAEAELIALSDGASQVIWSREFLLGQGYQPKASIIHQDNQATMQMASKGTYSSRQTRHINVRYFFLKDRIENGEVELNYLRTQDMIANLLTKPLQGEHFRRLRNTLLNWHY